MSKIKIVLSDVDAVINFESLPIVDTIFYIQIGNYCFPDNLWTDFAYPVLCMWTEEILRNQDKIKEQFTLSFMDGPFWIAVEQSNENLLLTCINGRTDNQVEFTAHCTVTEFLRELLRAFSKLEKIVSENVSAPKDTVKEHIFNTIRHYRKSIEGSLFTA